MTFFCGLFILFVVNLQIYVNGDTNNGNAFKPKCCSVSSDYKLLMSCLKGNPSNFTNFIEGSAPTTQYGPTLRIDYHSYELIAYDEATVDHGDGDDHRWNKVRLLYDALNPNPTAGDFGHGVGVGRDWDYIVWMDADLILLDFYMKIEMIINNSVAGASSSSSPHMWVSAEHEGSSTRINSGMLIFKNSMWSFHFLRAWWVFGNRKLYSDQEQFDLLYTSLLGGLDRYQSQYLYGHSGDATTTSLDRNKPTSNAIDAAERDEIMLYLFNYRSKSMSKKQTQRSQLSASVRYISIMPPHVLNSDPPAMVKQRASDGVLHLMGENLPYRKRVFSYGFDQICTSFSDSDSVMHNPDMMVEVDLNAIPVPLENESVGVDMDMDMNDSANNRNSTYTVVSNHHAVPWQLGLTQSNLLVWAIESYYHESHSRLEEYRLCMAASRVVSMSTSRLLSNAIHHYAYAVEHVNTLIWEQQVQVLRLGQGMGSTSTTRVEQIPYLTGTDCEDLAMTDEDWEQLPLINDYLDSGVISMTFEKLMFRWLLIGLHMRTEVFRLLKQNLKLMETSLEKKTQDALRNQPLGLTRSLTPLQMRCHVTTSNDLEMYKATAEAGQNLLHVKYYKSRSSQDQDQLSLRDKLQIADEIYQFLEGNVKQCCHKQQYQAVDVMMSQLHLDMGLMLYQNNYENADISIYVHIRHKLYESICENQKPNQTNPLENGVDEQPDRREHNIRLSVRHFKESIRILEKKPDADTKSIVENSGMHLLLHPYSCLIPALEDLGMKSQSLEVKMKLHALRQTET